MIVIDGFKENTKDKRKFQFQLAFPEFFEFMEVEKNIKLLVSPQKIKGLFFFRTEKRSFFGVNL